MTNDSEQLQEAPPAPGRQEMATTAEAARALACAFATIEELRNFLTPHVYDAIGDALNELCDDVDWQTDSALMRIVLPHIIRAAIEKREQFEL